MVTKAQALGTTLIQNIFERIPASLLIVASRPSKFTPTLSIVRTGVLVQSITANGLTSSVQLIAG